MKDKIIFLDVDGVLNSSESCNWAIKNNMHEIWRDMPYIKHLKELERVVKETGAKVVISSVWRHGCTSSTMWMCLFAALGVNIYVIGVTPRVIEPKGSKRFSIRGHEIQKWIDDRNKESKEEYAKNWNINEVGKFAIIDDDSDMAHLIPYLFKCDSKLVLTKEIADKVIKYLNK